MLTPEGLEAILCVTIRTSGILVVVSELTVDYFRKMLISRSTELLNDGELEGITLAMSNLSDERAFDFAVQLVPELNKGCESSVARNSVVFQRLTKSLRKYNDISYEEYCFLTNNLSSKMLSYIIYNESFPIDLLVDGEILYQREDSGYFLVEYAINQNFRKRYFEVVAYLRATIPGSEYMNDEMVMSVAGVKL